MEIHRFEKVWTVASLLLIVGFIGSIVYGAVGPGVAMVDETGGTVDVADVQAGNWDSMENFDEPLQNATHLGGDRYEAYVTAQRFGFTPGSPGNPIRVPADSTVTLHVTSRDVMHGFEVAGTNVNIMVIPGQVAEVDVDFGEPGTYHIVCSEYCGAAHHLMEGKLVVVPQSEFQGGEA